MTERIDFGATFENLDSGLIDARQMLQLLGRVSDHADPDYFDDDDFDTLEDFASPEDLEATLQCVADILRGVANCLQDIRDNDRADVARLAATINRLKAGRHSDNSH